MDLVKPLPQHLAAALKIRELILRGDLPPGTRVTEAALAERLGLSRTPVRQALPTLANDGLLVAVGKRGYAVRAFTAEESLTALETRAVLEGIAARTIAEKGLGAAMAERFAHCLARGDEILSNREVTRDGSFEYGEMNDTFHGLLLQAAERPLLSELIARCEAVPFVSPSLIAFNNPEVNVMYEDLFYAHRQHHYIVDALKRGEGSRVEMLMREHAVTQRHSMNL